MNRCKRCGRVLKNDDGSGYGPVCLKKHLLEIDDNGDIFTYEVKE